MNNQQHKDEKKNLELYIKDQLYIPYKKNQPQPKAQKPETN